MNIVIIDSGIEDRYNLETKYRVNFALDNNNAIINNDATDDKVGHGTFVYKLIKYYNTKKADVFIIKILNEKNQCKYELLLHALKYSLRIEAKVVVLCLATFIHDNRLEEIINKMYSKNIIILSSLMNGEKFSYPASMQKVIGVKGIDIESDRLFYYNEEDNIQVTCSAESLYTINQQAQLLRFGGNSKATALFACMLIVQIEENDTQQSIRNKMRKCSGKNVLPVMIRNETEANINKVIDKVYEKSYSLHKLDKMEFMNNSVWSFLTNVESVLEFIKIIIDECEVGNAIFRERDFVCIRDLVTNMICYL